MVRRKDNKIATAGCIIIGDEVLGGKTVDTNSAYFAKYCFSLGISLKRVEVIPDEQDDIIEAARRMSASYDFVVTSGGIGPTHDDITYESIAKAFGLPLSLHDESFQRMQKFSTPNHPYRPNWSWTTPSPELTAKKRMVELPLDSSRPFSEQVIFTLPDLWVPLCIVNGNVHILPGVPKLFMRMLEGYKPMLKPRLLDTSGAGDYRLQILTPMPESSVAGYLTELAKKVEHKGVKVGSYPKYQAHNTVTLVGKDRAYIDGLADEVMKNVQGKLKKTTNENSDSDDGLSS